MRCTEKTTRSLAHLERGALRSNGHALGGAVMRSFHSTGISCRHSACIFSHNGAERHSTGFAVPPASSTSLSATSWISKEVSPPARAWSPPTPTTAPSEAPSPGETPRDPKQPWDPKTAMKVGARSARDRHRRARGRSRGARGRFGAQLTWEAEVEEVGLYPELGS